MIQERILIQTKKEDSAGDARSRFNCSIFQRNPGLQPPTASPLDRRRACLAPPV